jgi:hypothetical protein
LWGGQRQLQYLEVGSFVDKGTQALCLSITCTFVFYSMNKEQEKTGQKKQGEKIGKLNPLNLT